LRADGEVFRRNPRGVGNDAHKVLREDHQQFRRRRSRIEHALLSLQRAQVDRLEDDAAVQDQIDGLTARLEERTGE
jgi:hypothetical protein